MDELDQLKSIQQKLLDLKGSIISTSQKQSTFDRLHFNINKLSKSITRSLFKSDALHSKSHKQLSSVHAIKRVKKLPTLKSTIDINDNLRSMKRRAMVESIEQEINNMKTDQRPQIQTKFIKKYIAPTKHLYKQPKSLNPLQRYHTFQPITINKQQYSAGLCQLINAYKSQSVDLTFLDQAKPKVIKPQLFKRNPKQAIYYGKYLNNRQANITIEDYTKNIYLTAYNQRNIQYPTPIKQVTENPTPLPTLTKSDSIEQNLKITQQTLQQSSILSASQINKPCVIFAELIYIHIVNYQIKNQSEFAAFKLEHLPSWGRIICFFKYIFKFLKKYQLKSATVKSSMLLQIDNQNRKVSDYDISTCLVNGEQIYASLKKIARKHQLKKHTTFAVNSIQTIFKGLMALKRLKSLDQHKLRNAARIIPILKYQLFKKKLKQNFKFKQQRVQQLQSLLRKDWKSYESAIQIHIPSFSASQWRRLSTHFMNGFQNQISRIWRSNSAHIILVLPSLNPVFLKFYEQLLPYRKNMIHVILPSLAHKFPHYLSLASVLYYSHDSMAEIKRLIKGKKAYIVPGYLESARPQILLSYELDCPLYCSNIEILQTRNFVFDKMIFENLKLPTQKYIEVSQKEQISVILKKIIQLLFSHKTVTIWLLKINLEFKGRGIARLNLSEQKQIKKLLDSQELTQQICEELYLRLNNILKHKLQFSFPNLYKDDEFIMKFMAQGGIIEAQMDKDLTHYTSYQVAMKIQPNQSYLLGCFKQILMTDYSNHAYLHQQITFIDIHNITRNLVAQISKYGFLGYVSYTFILHHTNQQLSYSMVDIKPYITSASESLFFFQSNYKYIYIPYLWHPNLMSLDSTQLIKSIKKSVFKYKNIDSGSLLFNMGICYSLIVSGRKSDQIYKLTVDILRHIFNKGFSKIGQKQFIRCDYYTLCQLVDSIKNY